MDATTLNRSAGMLFLRLLLGFIFLMQGYGKVFDIGVENIYTGGFAAYEATWLPVFVLKLTAFFTSYAELIGGALLVLGLFRSLTYYMMALVLVIVTYGHGLMSPIWDLQHVFFRAALLAPLFFLPMHWDTLALGRFVPSIFPNQPTSEQASEAE